MHVFIQHTSASLTVFSAKDDITGMVTFPEKGASPFTFKIADIGAGGLRFILPRDDAPETVSVNDKMMLGEIKGRPQLEGVADIELEVRWIMEPEMFAHMVIGCQFANISEEIQKQIDSFVESELASQDQEG